MSGKCERETNQMPGKTKLWLALGAAAVVLVCVLAAVLSGGQGGAAVSLPTPEGTQLENVKTTELALDKGLVITHMGSYTGPYLEDGSGEAVEDVLMLVVSNTGAATVQYAEITLSDGKNSAQFSLSTLAPGASMVVLEQGRMSYAEGKGLKQASAQNVALFQSEPSLHSEQLQIQALDGVLNVTNVSGEDITGDVVVYYKNSASDLLYGGITYRVTISGGIKAGEIKQIMASHFSASGSRVMFATVG